jgi:hypothetical protein
LFACCNIRPFFFNLQFFLGQGDFFYLGAASARRTIAPTRSMVRSVAAACSFAAARSLARPLINCLLLKIWLITEFWKNSAPRAEARGYL